ncbi:transposon-encoded TnpW family protein [Anaerotruncus rubiinfantis]|uniref:transposon-encoded TnpW family protein n=1 Tax=Anaerotruncus rubiinfantis TaxID=1720200 RepID=UPI0009AE2374|nr:transposon-encoded TnpW family protein [Anaerotruncus rubiinfantis]
MKYVSRGKKVKSEEEQFSERISSTTYLVSVHFSKTGKETFEDKIMRLIESEVKKTA